MAITYNTSIVRNGLVLHLDAANKKSYPGSGTTWTDLSGNGNHGTTNNAEYVAAGYFRNLNNASNFFTVTVPHSTSINNTFSVTTGGWTIEELIWTNSVVYPESDAGSVISNPAYGGTATGFDWNHGSLNTQFRFGVSSGGGVAPSFYDKEVIFSVSSPFNSLNAWKLRTMIWDRSSDTVSLYINSVYQGGGSITEVQGQPLYDGGGITFGALYGWKHYGRRAILRAYNKVLSTTEIQQNFNAVRGRYEI